MPCIEGISAMVNTSKPLLGWEFKVQRRKEKLPDWNWQDELISATLFLHIDGSKLSDIEWQQWVKPGPISKNV